MQSTFSKFALAGFVALAFSPLANAQWTTSGAGLNNVRNTNTGNIGIGVTVPTSKLDVNGTVKATSLNSALISPSSSIQSIKAGDVEITIDKTNSSSLYGAFEIFNGAGAHCLNMWEDGITTFYNNVTIQNKVTTSPTSALELQGNSTYGASLSLKNNDPSGLRWTMNSSPDGNFRIVKVTGSTHTPFAIEPNGRVSIGSLNPVAKLDVKNYDAGNYGGTVFSRAVAGVSSSETEISDGVMGEASGLVSYAVWGIHDKGDQGGDAGHFNGDLVYTGDLLDFSDARLKTDINLYKGGLEKIMALKPSTYFHRPEFKGMGLGEHKQIGFIAQEVEQVLPELVANKTDHSLSLENPLQLKAVNYVGMVPVLVAGMQEQQHQIDAQQAALLERDAKITELEERLAKIEASLRSAAPSPASGSMMSARPNPASEMTVLDLDIPASAASAQVTLFDAQGKAVRNASVDARGSVAYTLTLDGLANGTYFCTLTVDGRSAATRQIVVTKQ